MQALSKQEGLYNQAFMDRMDELDTRMKYRALSAAGLVIGSSSKAKVKIANTVTYLHNGIFKSKTTAEVAFTATDHDIVADSDTIQERKYLLCLAADGTPSIVAGDQADNGESLLPEIPSGVTVIGYVLLQIAAGSTDFDATTDELDEAHITDTYVDLGWLNERFDAAQ